VPPGEMVQSGNAAGESPCGDCYVTAMQATIKYPNGTEALTSEGAWLHHTVLSYPRDTRLGPIWAAGNERPTIRLNTDGNRYGINFPSKLAMSVDVMSERTEPLTVSMSITYEYIDKNSDMGKLYKASQMHWSQIGHPTPPDGKATFRTQPWVANVNGKLLYAIGTFYQRGNFDPDDNLGHMHDGGTHQTLMVNEQLVCNSTMFYGLRTGYDALESATESSTAAASVSGRTDSAVVIEFPKPSISPPEVSEFSNEDYPFYLPLLPSSWGSVSWLSKRSPQHQEDAHDGGAFGGSHISDPGACTDFAVIKKGDVITSEAHYDLQLHPTMSHDGKPERLMGNMRIYIGPE
jgi:hypothetical protein